jgi:uncharacterized RDD family membrane protein YckC
MVRGLAWLIDFILRIVIYLITAFLLQLLGGFGTGIILIILFAIEWFYPVIFEVRNGMTPGKRIMGIRVVHDDGTPVSWSSSLLRNLIRSVDFFPFFNITGFITMLMNSRFKRLGDLAAGTVVVYAKDRGHQFSIPDYPAHPPPLPLKLEEQRLILDFCERAGNLSTSRRHELATILSEFTEAALPENGLLSYGNWFLKGKSNNESKSV